MTPKERADKIVEVFNGKTFYLEETASLCLKDLIAAQIEEAEREAFKKGLVLDSYSEGYNTAKEQAAKIAKTHPANEYGSDVCGAIVFKIRAMSPEEKK